ncbi:MAG: TPM domain-containing protein [Muribaculaceae bacterium]|nr:TPM domain-containing protein [Muribaculaceae bacterium]
MKLPSKTDILTHLFVLLCLWPVLAWAEIPSPPTPPRLVNDFAGVLGNTQALEDSLAAFARHTGNQIVVITVNDLDGYEPWEYAQQVGQQWGVGGKKFNNGLVVLVKPKTPTSNGRAFIATGYGLEGALTDATCTQIVNREMIPHFKENDYQGGVWQAVRVLMPIAAGEYSEEQYLDNDDDANDVFNALLVIFILVFILVVSSASHGGGSNDSNRGGNTGTWGGPIIWGGGSSNWGSSSGSSWGGGGFGGFGGGSFGGGGGGGSW